MSVQRKRKLCRLMMGEKNDSIETPMWLFESLNDEFHFDHDPCPMNWEKQDPSTRQPDGLLPETEWGDCSFVNPPFSHIKKWIVKGLEESRKGKTVVFLLSARINTKYWKELVWKHACEVRLLSGFISFKGHDKPLPIPMSVVIYDTRRKSLDFSSGFIHRYPTVIIVSHHSKLPESSKDSFQCNVPKACSLGPILYSHKLQEYGETTLDTCP